MREGKPTPAVSAAIFHDGKVLLAQRGKPPLTGVWSLPGGHIEVGEKARDAVARELAEETGIVADIVGIADVTDVILRHDDGSVRAQYVITVFYGHWQAGEARAMSDCQAVDWVAPDMLPDRKMTEGTAAIIAHAAALLANA
ncbi:MAG: NUDIX hydrolase [Hyphomicrobiaceae bacterium]|nr:NUDIX hydrolase [Hyphomicrobiaceae bacterium]